MQQRMERRVLVPRGLYFNEGRSRLACKHSIHQTVVGTATIDTDEVARRESTGGLKDEQGQSLHCTLSRLGILLSFVLKENNFNDRHHVSPSNLYVL